MDRPDGTRVLFASEKQIPDTTGKPVAVAVNQIQDANRPVGAVVGTPVENPKEVGKVIEQVPEPGALTESGKAVSLVVGTSSNGKRTAKNKKAPRKSSGS